MRAINAVATTYVMTAYVAKQNAKFSTRRTTKNIQPTSFPDTDRFPAVSNVIEIAGAKHTNNDIVATIREIHLRLSASGATIKHRKPIKAHMTKLTMSFILSIFINIRDSIE